MKSGSSRSPSLEHTAGVARQRRHWGRRVYVTGLGNKVVKSTSHPLQDALTRCRVWGVVRCRVGGSGAGSGVRCRVGGVRCRVGGGYRRKQGAEKRVPKRLGKRDSDCLHMFTAEVATIADRWK